MGCKARSQERARPDTAVAAAGPGLGGADNSAVAQDLPPSDAGDTQMLDAVEGAMAPPTEAAMELAIGARYKAHHDKAVDQLRAHWGDLGDQLGDGLDGWCEDVGSGRDGIARLLSAAPADGDGEAGGTKVDALLGDVSAVQLAVSLSGERLTVIDKVLNDLDDEDADPTAPMASLVAAYDALSTLSDRWTEPSKSLASALAKQEEPTLIAARSPAPDDAAEQAKAGTEGSDKAEKKRKKRKKKAPKLSDADTAFDDVVEGLGELRGWLRKPVKTALKKSRRLRERQGAGGDADNNAALFVHGTARARSAPKVKQERVDRALAQVELGWDAVRLPMLWKLLDADDVSGALADDLFDEDTRAAIEDAITAHIRDGAPASAGARAVLAALDGGEGSLDEATLARLETDLTAFIARFGTNHDEMAASGGQAAGQSEALQHTAARLEEALARGNRLAVEVMEAGADYPFGPVDFAWRLQESYAAAGIPDMFAWYESGLSSVYFLNQESVTIASKHAGSLTKASNEYLQMAAESGQDQAYTVDGNSGGFNFRARRSKAKKGILCGEAESAWKSHHSTGRAIDVNYGQSGSKKNMFVTDPEVWKVVEMVLVYAGETGLTAEDMASGKKSNDILDKISKAGPVFQASYQPWRTSFIAEVPGGGGTELPTDKEVRAALEADGVSKEALKEARAKQKKDQQGLKAARRAAYKADREAAKGLKSQTRSANKQLRESNIRADDLEANASHHAKAKEGVAIAAASAAAYRAQGDAGREAVRGGGDLEPFERIPEARGRAEGDLAAALHRVDRMRELAVDPPATDGKKKKKDRRKRLLTVADSVAAKLQRGEALDVAKKTWEKLEAKQAAIEADAGDPVLAKVEKADDQLVVVDALRRFDRKYLQHFEQNGFVDVEMLLVTAMESNGWTWGGRWSTPDFMHFQID